MAIAVDPKQTFQYVLKCDRDLADEEQTVFELRGLTTAEEARVADSMITSVPGESELSLRSGTHQLTLLRAGLRGWRNLRDAAGVEVPFESTKGHPGSVTDKSLDRLLPAWRTELANAVSERGEIDVVEGN